MRKALLLIILSFVTAIMIIPASMLCFADAENGEAQSNWTEVSWSNDRNSYTVNENGSVTVDCFGKRGINPDAIAFANVSEGTTDFAYKFHINFSESPSQDSPFFLAYGIMDVGQVNMTFYGNGNNWSNAIVNGESFSKTDDNVKYSANVAYNPGWGPFGAAESQFGYEGGVGASAIIGFGEEWYLNPMMSEYGHDFIVRVMKVTDGTLIKIYYGQGAATFYTFKITSDVDAVNHVERSFIGVHIQDSAYTVSNVETYVKKQSNWMNAGVYDLVDFNIDGGVTVCTIPQPDPDPFNLAVKTVPTVDESVTDFAYRYHFAMRSVTDNPITFTYGVENGETSGKTAIIFYGNNGDWTNMYVGSCFDDATAMKYSSHVAEGQVGTGVGSVIYGIKETYFRDLTANEGHDIIFRVTKTEGGVKLRIYYGSIERMFFEYDITSAVASDVAHSYFGFKGFFSNMALSNVSCFDVNVHRFADEYTCRDRICLDCGYVLSATTEHSFGERFDCQDKTCVNCGETVKATVEHKFADEHACHDRKCTVCGELVKATAEHSGGTATCTEQATCTQCGEKYGSLAAHIYADEHACHDRKCTVCGEVVKATAEHTFGDNAICHDRTCTVCGENIKAGGSHEYANDHACEDRTCVNCGEVVKATAEHTFDDDVTCHDRTCTVCGYIVTATTNHTYTDEATCHDRTCTKCGYVEQATTTHTGGVATCTEPATCAKCGEKYGKTGDHKYVNGKCEFCGKKTTKGCVTVSLTSVMTVVAVAVCAGIFLMKRK